jgi:hypothetical protein
VTPTAVDTIASSMHPTYQLASFMLRSTPRSMPKSSFAASRRSTASGWSVDIPVANEPDLDLDGGLAEVTRLHHYPRQLLR